MHEALSPPMEGRSVNNLPCSTSNSIDYFSNFRTTLNKLGRFGLIMSIPKDQMGFKANLTQPREGVIIKCTQNGLFNHLMNVITWLQMAVSKVEIRNQKARHQFMTCDCLPQLLVVVKITTDNINICIKLTKMKF